MKVQQGWARCLSSPPVASQIPVDECDRAQHVAVATVDRVARIEVVVARELAAPGEPSAGAEVVQLAHDLTQPDPS